MKPEPGTYPSFYNTYISKVDEDNLLLALEHNFADIKKCLAAIPGQKENYAYAEGKWTVKQLVNHLIDTERIFAYRALRFARKDPQLLPSFEENDYAEAADVSTRSMADLLLEFDYVRLSTLALFKSFSPQTLMRTGLTPAGSTTVLAIGFAICGHANHHLAVLKEKYL